MAANHAVLETGDRVVIVGGAVRKKAVILGFGETAYGRLNDLGFEPGVWRNRVEVRLRTADGEELTELGLSLLLADQAEFDRRMREREQHWNDSAWRKNRDFLRPLPETKFWEGDMVRRKISPDARSAAHWRNNPYVARVVSYIEYPGVASAYAPKRATAGYRLAGPAVLRSPFDIVPEEELVLAERGNAWRYCHNQPLRFGDLKEAARFYFRIGQAETVPHPETGLHSWTKDDAHRAVWRGAIHGYIGGRGSSYRALRFRDENLGEQVRRATMQDSGFLIE